MIICCGGIAEGGEVLHARDKREEVSTPRDWTVSLVMSRPPYDPSLSSIHDSSDSLEAEFAPRTRSDSSRTHKHDRELSSLRAEVEALKHMFLERSGALLRLELTLEKAVRQLASESEKLDERRKQPDRTKEGNSTCVFPNPPRTARSAGDFSFSNQEADETTMFSFGEIDENIEVLSPYTAKYPSDMLDLEGREMEHNEVLLVPCIYEPRRTGCEPSKSYPVLLGEVIAERYRIDAIIAATNFSIVLQCYSLHQRREVCVKVLHYQKEVLDQGLDELKVWRLVETKCGDRLHDKHLARLLDYFYFKEHLFIVSELLGENLYLLYSSPDTQSLLSPDNVKAIAKQVLEALECLHSLGVIHADVKPENILLTAAARKVARRPQTISVTLVDFGSSCFLADEPTPYIQSQAYRAPEVIVGESYTTKIDIWSVGCVVAELSSGEVLLAADSALESLHKVKFTQIKAVLGEVPVTGPLLPTFQDQFGVLKVLPSSNSTLPLEARFPSDSLLTHFLKSLLRVAPDDRPTASEALHHPWLSSIQ